MTLISPKDLKGLFLTFPYGVGAFGGRVQSLMETKSYEKKKNARTRARARAWPGPAFTPYLHPNDLDIFSMIWNFLNGLEFPQ